MSSTASSALAVNGGKPVRGPEKQWPAWPIFDDTDRAALNEVLESGKWWYGDRVAHFEEEYAEFQNARHCVTCTSGTTAIEIVLQALGIQPGDEVIVPPYTFIATASAVARCGAFPIFVDVDDSWDLDPDLIEEAITARTRAIMPVHFGGRVCDMDRINAIGNARGIPVIEDACHSWGSKWKGKGTGALGRCGVFSFQMSKNLTAGEGGAILTDDDDLADLCRSISNCGRAKGGQWYEHPNIGTNARLTEFAGALLSAQLGRLAMQTLVRERNGAFLAGELGAIEGLTPQPGDGRITRRAYHLYGLRVDEEAFGCSRARLCEAAEAEGLPLSPGYAVPLYKQPAFARIPGAPDYTRCHCPVTEDMCYKSVCWMPHPLLLGGDTDMRDIVDIFTKIKEHAGELAG